MHICLVPNNSADFDAKYIQNASKLEIIGHYRLKTMELTEMMINWTLWI